MTVMDFEILISDDYLKLVQETPETQETKLTPVDNKTVLSLVNDFEDEKWRDEKFNNFVWDNIALTALSAKEREKLAGKSASTLRAAAKNLRLTDKEGDKEREVSLRKLFSMELCFTTTKPCPSFPRFSTNKMCKTTLRGLMAFISS